MEVLMIMVAILLAINGSMLTISILSYKAVSNLKAEKTEKAPMPPKEQLITEEERQEREKNEKLGHDLQNMLCHDPVAALKKKKGV